VHILVDKGVKWSKIKNVLQINKLNDPSVIFPKKKRKGDMLVKQI
jgi:hypothetical protein